MYKEIWIWQRGRLSSIFTPFCSQRPRLSTAPDTLPAESTVTRCAWRSGHRHSSARLAANTGSTAKG
jgi:hypothetical protein